MHVAPACLATDVATAGSISHPGGVWCETVETPLEAWPFGAGRSSVHEEPHKGTPQTSTGEHKFGLGYPRKVHTV